MEKDFILWWLFASMQGGFWRTLHQIYQGYWLHSVLFYYRVGVIRLIRKPILKLFVPPPSNVSKKEFSTDNKQKIHFCDPQLCPTSSYVIYEWSLSLEMCLAKFKSFDPLVSLSALWLSVHSCDFKHDMSLHYRRGNIYLLS